MRACWISYSDISSGNATRVLNLAKNMPDDVKIDIIFDSNGKDEIPKEFRNLNIEFTPYLGTTFLTLLFGIFYKMKYCFKDYDIVHCFKPLPTSYYPSYFVSKTSGAKLILDVDDWEGKGGFADKDSFPIGEIIDRMQIPAQEKSDAVIVATEFLEKVSKQYNKRVYFIPNGANVLMFKPKKRKKNKKFTVVFLGILYKTCELDVVLKALTYAKTKNIELLVIGDGPRRKEFEDMAKKLNIEEKVKFLGMKKREEVPHYISLADVVTLPMTDNLVNRSRSPVKLGEYMASGKAIIANNIGVIKSVVKTNYNGIVVDNEKEFGEAIDRLARDHKLRRKIEKNARNTAEDKLDWKKIAKDLERVYLNLT